MSEPTKPEQEFEGITREQMMSALFAQLVVQQSNMALMLLGKVPHPQTGETIRDIEAARLFIDQIEMLETKTKGNLTKEEEQLLKQSLMSLRMAFVDAVQPPAAEPKKVEGQAAPAAESKTEAKIETGAASASDEESKKKFTKKY